MQKWETISFFNADPNTNLLVGSRSALITHSDPDLDGNCHSHKNWCMKSFVCAVFKSLILLEMFNFWFKNFISKN